MTLPNRAQRVAAAPNEIDADRRAIELPAQSVQMCAQKRVADGVGVAHAALYLDGRDELAEAPMQDIPDAPLGARQVERDCSEPGRTAGCAGTPSPSLRPHHRRAQETAPPLSP